MIYMLHADTGLIRKKMNEYGKRRQPYLFILNFEMTEGYFIPNPLEQKEILFQINEQGNKPKEHSQQSGSNTKITKTNPIKPEAYKAKFEIVQQGLRYGNSFLTNLTIRTPIETNCSLEDIFLQSNAKYQILVPERFVCFSPEGFVRIGDGMISTYPMKGTIDASIPDAEQLILDDYKETAEHNTVVDLLRNDLSIHANQVQVKRFRYIDRIQTSNKEILQVSSEVIGKLDEGYHSSLGDILFDMLPAGSITGAPKAATVTIIRQAEQKERGYYSGICGYYDGETLDSGVLIRFVEEQDGKRFFRSGGGITIFSEWEKEYEEVLDKIYLPSV